MQKFLRKDLRHYQSSLVDAMDAEELEFSGKSLYLALRGALSGLAEGGRKFPIVQDQAIDAFLHGLQDHRSEIVRLGTHVTAVEKLLDENRRDTELNRKELADLGQQVMERGEDVAHLQAQVAEKVQVLAEVQGHVRHLEAGIATRDEQIREHAGALAERTEQLATLTHSQNQLSTQVHDLSAQLVEQDKAVADLQAQVEEKGQAITALSTQVVERNERITSLTQAQEARDAELEGSKTRIAALEDAVASREAELKELNQRAGEVKALRQRVASREAQLSAVYASRSWQFTAPIRTIRGYIRLCLTNGLRAGNRLLRERRLLLSSAAFDGDYYCRHYPDVAAARTDPALHYLLYGASEGRNPNPLFDTDWYLKQNPDVSEAGVNPLAHYLRFGASEGRDPSSRFVSSSYLDANPDVAAAGVNPLAHYLRFGMGEGRSCSLHVAAGGHGGRDNRTKAVVAPQAGVKSLPRKTRLFWDLMQMFWRIRIKMAPLNSRRDRILRLGARGFWVWRHEGGRILFRKVFQKMRPRFKNRVKEEATISTSKIEIISEKWYATTYFNLLASAKGHPSSDFAPLAEADLSEEQLAVKLIAFYLPQFHPIPENDAWWGKGFTEWTNVTKAVPQFVGHYQPRLPSDLGFYDLRVKETKEEQIRLARKHGIHGFCYHHYWFGGKRLLETPFKQVLEDPDLDFRFCLCWANENWTRRWDGQDDEVLIAQSHSPEDDIAFIKDIEPSLRDSRYIRINGRPLLIVYRAAILPDPGATLLRWRQYCRNAGLGELCLVAAQTFGFGDPRPYGFDAAVEFPPHNIRANEITTEVQLLNPNFAGKIFDYASLVHNASKEAKSKVYPTFRTVMTSWDNEARRPGRGHVYANATPRLYAQWLREACAWTLENRDVEDRFIFINAWNEWAEATYLEPDRRYGYAYLRATAEVLRPYCKTPPTPIQNTSTNLRLPSRGKVDCAVITHVFFPDIWHELSSFIGNIQIPFDLWVSIPTTGDERLEKQLCSEFPSVRILKFENRGRDMAPFASILRDISAASYSAVCKIHTKRAMHRSDGIEWRRDVLKKLLGSPQTVRRLVDALSENPHLGIIGPTGHILPSQHYWGIGDEAQSNRRWIQSLSKRAGLAASTEAFRFVAGSMFWFRPSALDTLLDLDLSLDEFEREARQKDGTLAHALERFIGLAALARGYEVAETRTFVPDEPATSWLVDGEVGTNYLFAAATRDGVPV